MKKILLFALLIIFAVSAKSKEISLNGKWCFAIDLTIVGEQNDWHLLRAVAKDNESLLAAGFFNIKLVNYKSRK